MNDVVGSLEFFGLDSFIKLFNYIDFFVKRGNRILDKIIIEL